MKRTLAWVLWVCLLCSCESAQPEHAFYLDGHIEQKDPALLGSRTRLLAFDLSRGVPETADPGALFTLPAAQTYVGLVRAIARAERDDSISGAFVRLGGIDLGWARSEELGRQFSKLGKAKKPVVCHAHALSNTTAWLALLGCDRIWLSRAGEVATVGLAAELVYLKNALDKLHIKADFLHVGEFKSGVEPFTREGPSEKARKDLTATLASIRSIWHESAARARKQPQLVDALEHGPWTPERAKARGLVDALGSEIDAYEEAQKRAKTYTTEVAFGGSGAPVAALGLTEIVRSLVGADARTEGRPHLALVPAFGAITTSAEGIFGPTGITSKALVKTLRELKEDSSVKAVVLRLDSPGGSPLASDLIWQAVMDLKQDKPVIVSVGDMAASGGYYIASAGTKILAERTSIVGSIGVFGGKVVLGEALQQVGINTVIVPASPEPGAAARAAYLSPFESWDEATRERMRAQLQSIYQLFLRRVVTGRNMEKATVEKSAEGRIFSGQTGKERGLVDEIGGLTKAIELGLALGGLDPEAPVVVKGMPQGLLEMLMEPAADAAEATLALVQGKEQQSAQWIPRDLLPFAASLAPLADGESVVAALPFSLVLR